VSANKKPIRVGIVLDFPIEDVKQGFLDAVRLAMDEATESGIVDRGIELVVHDVEGLPRGEAHDVVMAWQELVDAGVVAVIGPLISDNSLAVAEHQQTAARKVPTLTWSGTDRQYSDYIFGLGNGSLPEEPYLMAEWLKDQGRRTVGVVYERASTGLEYLEFFVDACLREGLEIVHSEGVGQSARDTSATVSRLRDRNPDALAYLGFGLPGIEMNMALSEIRWDPPRVMCAAFINCYVAPAFMDGLKGWVGVDQWDETNTVGQEMLARFEKRFGYRQDNCVPTLAHDCGAALALGIGHARTLTPDGVKDGLEKVKALPSATGGPGTRISFGRYNRRGWHGVDYLLLREINDDNGTTLVGRFRR
jgi:ABC-type branched-subunit amino acid transport system substrate-binding protein